MTDRNYGFELEVPFSNDADDAVGKGKPGKRDAEYRLNDALPDGLEATWERIGKSEYGIEVRTVTEFSYQSLIEKYHGVLEAISSVDDVDFNPCGIYGETTAGIHIHVSPITTGQAESLVNVSKRPWLQVLCGISICIEDGAVVSPVLRSQANTEHSSTNYCRMKLGQHKHCVVNSRESGHYEWRLPEPVGGTNFSAVMEFLDRFLDGDHQGAIRAVKMLLGTLTGFSAPSGFLTSVQRARKLQGAGHELRTETAAAQYLVNVVLDQDV